MKFFFFVVLLFIKGPGAFAQSSPCSAQLAAARNAKPVDPSAPLGVKNEGSESTNLYDCINSLPGNPCSKEADDMICSLIGSDVFAQAVSAAETCLLRYAQQQTQPQSLTNKNTDSSTDPVVSSGSDSSELVKCEQKAQEAASSCTTENNSEYKELISMTDRMARAMQTATATSMALACSGVAQASQMANGFLASYKVYCSSAVSSCQSACSAADSAVRSSGLSSLSDRLSAARRTCSSAAQRAQGVDSQIAGIAQTQMNSQACNNLTATHSSLPSLADCRVNPALQGCSSVLGVDCAIPEIASTNVTCVCQKNPRDSRCGYAAKSSSSTVSTGDGIGGTGSRLTGDLGAPPPSALDFGTNNYSGGGGFQEPSKTGSPNLGGGGGGPSGGFFGGANAPGQKRAPDRPGSNLNSKIIAGYRGGGSGGGGFVGGSTRGMGPGPGQPGASGSASAQRRLDVDYRKFLPKDGYSLSRHIAQENRPDGITGPYTNNFEKVRVRYGALQRSLLP